MTNTGSRWGDVVVATVAALDAALACDVFDGPPTSGDQLSSFVAIGHDPDSDEPTAGDVEQEWHDLGAAATREEHGRIRCYVSAWAGDLDLPTVRATALTILDTIQTTLRANPTLSLTGTRAPVIEVEDIALRQGFTQSGTRVDVPFTIAYDCLI